MSLFPKPKRRLVDRSSALSGRPERLPFIRREETAEGGMQVTVKLVRPRWQRWLGGTGEIERTFRLDCLGRQVYEACNGKTNVKAIIKDFAADHKISLPEAEESVTMFLRTMMMKGLIGVAVDRKSGSGQ